MERIITDSFTYEDIEHTIKRDQAFVLHQLNELEVKYAKLIKQRKPRGNFSLNPVVFHGRRGLDYICIMNNPSYDDYKKRGVLYQLYTIYLKKEGFYVWYEVQNGHFGGFATMRNHYYIIFTPHYFDRYKERYLQNADIPKKEVVFSYIKANIRHVAQEQNNPEYPNGLYLFCQHGLGLGNKLVSGNIEAKTFVTAEMLKGMQTEFAEEAMKHIEEYNSKITSIPVALIPRIMEQQR